LGFREALGELRASYTIATVPRSGSNHLCAMLAQAGVANPTEHFHHTHPMFKDADLDDLLARIIRKHTVKGVFGSKMFPDQRAWLELAASQLYGKSVLVHDIFPVHRWVRLTRDDKVRQAISLYRARKTDEWLDVPEDKSTGRQVEYDYAGILGALREIMLAEASWDQYFASYFHWPIHSYSYEDMIVDPKAVTGAIASMVQVPDFQGVSASPETPFRVQRDNATHEMARRFREDFLREGATFAA
jgi:LPS sulfotransferase NodH